MAANASFSSPLASASFRIANVQLPPQVDTLLEAFGNTGPVGIFFAILALLVAYDQCMLSFSQSLVLRNSAVCAPC